MPKKYIKIWKDSQWQKVSEDRLQRFLDQGWGTDAEQDLESQSNSSKNRITASAEVTSNPEVVEETQEEVCEDCEQEPCECEDDELPINEEN